MITFGISANEHDASIAVIRDNEIVFASHSERFSRIKNDPHLHQGLISEALKFGNPELIVWYEKPFSKRLRKFWAGQYDHVLRTDGRAYLRKFGLTAPVEYVSHHESHAAGGYYTSPFDNAAILVVDAIGEWETLTAWHGRGEKLQKLASQRYPHSLGLLYSAFTQRVGLKPNEEEFILMGMAAFAEPEYFDVIWNDFILLLDPPVFRLRENVHRGVRWWRPELQDKAKLAASIQKVTERILVSFAKWLERVCDTRCLVLMGGVALNCVANSKIAEETSFDSIWIMPSPGDAGSSIGAVAAHLRRHLHWRDPYLGLDIARPFDGESALSELLQGRPIGIANGRAEFGPRALGNRSLLADPRIPAMKNGVNDIKKREKFRPFAPVVMAEHARAHFEMPVLESPYMQFVGKVRQPDFLPAISHVDGTARIQTVSEAQHPQLYNLLSEFYKKTGCPILLNTSLNIKGEPLVNSWADAVRFENLYGVRVF
jgi:carbamoyltransferase